MKYFFKDTMRKLRSIAFQRCITLYSQKWTVWPWEAIFCKKLPEKQLFEATRIWIKWLWRGLGPPILKVPTFSTCSLKPWGKSFQMSYREARWRQYCPNGGPLLCSGGADTENCKKVHFLLLSLLLDNFVKKNSTRIGPCERARTQLSEYVWHLGVLMI